MAESIRARFATVLLAASGCFLRFGCGSEARGGFAVVKVWDLSAMTSVKKVIVMQPGQLAYIQDADLVATMDTASVWFLAC